MVDKKAALAGGVLRSSCSVDCCCLTYSLIKKLCLCFLVTIPIQIIILETIVTCIFVKILDILTILPYYWHSKANHCHCHHHHHDPHHQQPRGGLPGHGTSSHILMEFNIGRVARGRSSNIIRKPPLSSSLAW